MNRERLPNRRATETFDVEANGQHYTATVSRFADGRIGEVFLANRKSNSQADTNARNSGIALPFALQHARTRLRSVWPFPVAHTAVLLARGAALDLLLGDEDR
jgi:hypothetical protein